MFRKILSIALKVAGNQENLASMLGISNGCLSKKINGDAGWFEADFDKLFEISAICSKCKLAHSKQLEAFMEVIRTNLEYIKDLESKE